MTEATVLLVLPDAGVPSCRVRPAFFPGCDPLVKLVYA
jgi:hypothetical protein